MNSPRNINIINVRITHETATTPLIEAVAFRNSALALSTLNSWGGVDECAILQTCNRVELYLVSGEGENLAIRVKEFLAKRAGALAEEASAAIEYSLNQGCMRHILRLASGLESMIVGEDQILHQVWDAFLEARGAKTAGAVLEQLFMRAVSVGRRVRKETGINKGAVSIGSAAVELAESLLGKLDEKKVLVMGAGEMGTLVAHSLARRCKNPIFIANRTYDKAEELANLLYGRAIKFDMLEEALVDADLVICSTNAPHYILTKERLSKVVGMRESGKPLTIIDISNPSNVEKTSRGLEHVMLYDIDDLRAIAERNKQKRLVCIEKANEIIEEELESLSRDMRIHSVREIVSRIFYRAEEIRQREVAEAIRMLGYVNEKERKIIEDLTFILLKQTHAPIVENLRQAAKDDDCQVIDAAIKLFGIEKLG